MFEPITDLLIVGAGPAGAACAVQAARDDLDLLLIGDELPGGLVRAAYRLKNLPGYPEGIAGVEFAELLNRHLTRFGIVYRKTTVLSVAINQEGNFACELSNNEQIMARALVLATGTQPRSYSVPGLAPANDAGLIDRDIRSLPDRLDHREVAIIGGGEAAADTALSVRSRGGNPRIYVRGSAVRLYSMLRREIEEAGIPVEIGWDLQNAELHRGKLRLSWQTHHGPTMTIAHRLMICIGREPRRELWLGLRLPRASAMEVETAVPGLFLAGDLIRGDERYAATAIGDGQRSAMAAAKYLKRRRDGQWK